MALGAKVFRLGVLVMTEPAIEIPHVRIMGRRKGFVGLDDNLLVVCMTGKALLLFGWLGRLCHPMTFSTGHSIELMAVAQRHFPSKACRSSMTSLTGGASHAFHIHVSGGKHFFAPVAYRTIPRCCSLHLLRFSP
jgi:hypothetical protein